jgi:hypothetical protein
MISIRSIFHSKIVWAIILLSVEKIAREELGLTKPDEILIKGIEK